MNIGNAQAATTTDATPAFIACCCPACELSSYFAIAAAVQTAAVLPADCPPTSLLSPQVPELVILYNSYLHSPFQNRVVVRIQEDQLIPTALISANLTKSTNSFQRHLSAPTLRKSTNSFQRHLSAPILRKSTNLLQRHFLEPILRNLPTLSNGVSFMTTTTAC